MIVSSIDNTNPETCVVAWEVSNKCNYSCWYCPEHLHSGTFGWPDVDESLRFINTLSSMHKNVFITFVGGEPTLWPKMLDFFKRLPDNVSTDITSNASRTEEWWKRSKPFLNRVVLTFHPNTADVDHFVKIAELLNDEIDLYTMLMFDPAKEEKLRQVAKRLKESNISYHFKPIYPDFGPKMLDYTEEQKEMILNDQHVSTIRRKPTIKPSNNIFVDGKQMKIRTLLMNGLNRFKGFKCMAGSKRLHVTFEGKIYAGSCQARFLGTIKDPVFMDEPLICPKDSCQCADDVKVKKWKVG
jgi:MoaA/NifB/PqqE/SkfB family radical SAM enzyme